MDINIEKKKASKFKLYAILAVLAVVLFFGLRYVFFLSQADFQVDKDTLVFDEVRQGKFTVSVRGTGVLVPDEIEWLSSSVEGRVQKLLVKPGNIVKTGDLIAELVNPQLQQDLIDTQWELEALDAELEAARVGQQSALQQQKADVLNTKLDYESSITEYQARSELVQTGAVSRLDYERTRLARDQAEQRWLASQEELKQMQENLNAQNVARAARLNQARKKVERAQQQVDDLNVKATFDSIVLEVPLEAGQRVSLGANIAKLAQQGSLIAELQVPEILISDVAVGQAVVIDTRNNKIGGAVSRVDPAVINGNVQVDVVFSDELPVDARPDLSVDGEIMITEIDDTLYVDRPLFAQSKSDSAFYKVIENGQLAERIKVKLGYGSVNQIQVLEGLQAGDRIIVSDSSRFEGYEKFRIN